jgi:hypothetical protein
MACFLEAVKFVKWCQQPKGIGNPLAEVSAAIGSSLQICSTFSSCFVRGCQYPSAKMPEGIAYLFELLPEPEGI